MGQRVKIFWSERSRRDLRNVINYIKPYSPQRALALVEMIIQKVTRLARYPGSGRRVPEFEVGGVSPFREIIAAPYRVIYILQEGRVNIIAVVHGRQGREISDLSGRTREKEG